MGNPTDGVIILPVRRSAPRVIQQSDLEEFFFLRREKEEALRRYRAKRQRLIELLEAGATIEPGVHTARLEAGRRGRRLVVR